MASTGIRSLVNGLFEGRDAFQVCLIASAVTVATHVVVSNTPSLESLQKSFFANALKAGGETVAKQQQEAAEMVAKELDFDVPEGVGIFNEIPEKGLSHEQVKEQLQALANLDRSHWDGKRVSGCVYWGDDRHAKLLAYAQELFLWSNPLHPDVFPTLTKIEREICRMTAHMLGAPKDLAKAEIGGVITSGGTESILMAVKSYRDDARRRGILYPEIVACDTAHAAFDKAADYFGVKLVKVPVAADGSQRIDINKARRACTRNTVALVGSAPQYPHGAVDDIDALAAIARSRQIGLHVDSCLGGYLLPWLREIGVDFGTGFDFGVDGVTSISCDTHKYAYTAKGTSVLLFRGTQLKRAMYFVATAWPGGTYASPTMAGSRPGSVSAACWASLLALGKDNFLQLARGIHTTFEAIKKALANGECGASMRLVGDSRAMVIAVDSSEFDVQRWASAMSEKGWNLNRLQSPNSVHMCITAALIGCEEQFVQDSSDVHAALLADESLHADGAAKLYGMTNALPGVLKDLLVSDLAKSYLDAKTN